MTAYKFFPKTVEDKREIDFNKNWKFHLGNVEMARDNFLDDSDREDINLPHDYSINLPYRKDMEAQSAYKEGGIGRYRKSFFLPKSLSSKKIYITFEGVYMEGTFYINGKLLGSHPYGYTPASFDLTNFLNFGEENCLAVFCNNPVPTSRWYSGSGIYRDVTLTVCHRVHFDLYPFKIESDFLGSMAKVKVQARVFNEEEIKKNFKLRLKIFDRDTRLLVSSLESGEISIEPGQKKTLALESLITGPKLRSPDSPNLYVLVGEILEEGRLLDSVREDFGIRTYKFDKDRGFFINGKNIKLKGVCLHHDHGGLGAVDSEDAIRRQVRLLKEMGANTIRSTHNPASPKLIDICNQEGLLLIDEAFDGWVLPKNGDVNDYSRFFEEKIGDSHLLFARKGESRAEFDLKAMIYSSLNAPSVIMYSLCNEVLEGTDRSRKAEYPAIMEKLVGRARELDQDCYLTQGDNMVSIGYQEEFIKMDDCLVKNKGAIGVNYRGAKRYDQIRKDHPNYPLYGSETASSINSRGVYDRIENGIQREDKLLTSYDKSCVSRGGLASQERYDCITRDFFAGECVWTGFDYLGEPTPWNGVSPGPVGPWPSPKSSYFGIIDTAGLPKDSYYFYQSQWREDVTTLHLLPAREEGEVCEIDGKVPVVCYSSAKSVELFFTPEGGERRSLGEKFFDCHKTPAGFSYRTERGKSGHESLYFTRYLPFERGRLEAVARDEEGRVIEETSGRKVLETPGKPYALKVTGDREKIRANGKDLVNLEIEIVDKEGRFINYPDNEIEVEVEGPAKLLAMDNGRQDDHTLFKQNKRRAFKGRLLASLQSLYYGGEIRVKVSSQGLLGASYRVYSMWNAKTDKTGARSYSYERKLTFNSFEEISLPKEVIANLYTGEKKKVGVSWEKLPDLSKAYGSFTVFGLSDYQDRLSLNISLVNQVASALNYSCQTEVGKRPSLAKTRPLVLEDGSLVSGNFPVTREEIPEGDLEKEGTYIIKGETKVFEESFPVEASIRVHKKKTLVGSNKAYHARKITTNIPEGLESDSISALVDKNTSPVDLDRGDYSRESLRSDYKFQREEGLPSELVFSYDTQLFISQIRLYFVKDGEAYPNPKDCKIYLSDTGAASDRKELSCEIQVGPEARGARPVTYLFEPSRATFVKFVFESPKGTYTALSEVEIYSAILTDEVYSSTDFTSIFIDGYKLREEDLEKDFFEAKSSKGEVLLNTRENAALTILPEREGKIFIFLESEDGRKIRKFTISLNK